MSNIVRYYFIVLEVIKADKKLKMAAATMGCPFVLMISDKTTVGANSNTIGGSQAIKTGLAYKFIRK